MSLNMFDIFRINEYCYWFEMIWIYLDCVGAQGVSCFAAPKVLEVGHRCGGAVQAPSSSLEVLAAASDMKPRPPWAATATEFQDKATIVRQENGQPGTLSTFEHHLCGMPCMSSAAWSWGAIMRSRYAHRLIGLFFDATAPGGDPVQRGT